MLPIANTIEERRAVKELLNYDDAVYVVYSKGGETVSVYIAYWQPGKMSYRLIAGHAPDICWINSGWVCTHSEICNNISDGEVTIWPVQERLMEMNGRSELVRFWHIVGGRAVYYPTGGPRWYSAFTDLLKNGLSQREEQYFIRISINTPASQDSNILMRNIIAKIPCLYRKP